MHYSVTESSGHVIVTVLKKIQGHEMSFGIRTVDGEAKAAKDNNTQPEYEAFN